MDGVTLLDDYCYDTYYTDTYNTYCMPLKLGPRRDAIEAIISTDIMIARRIAGDFYIVKYLLYFKKELIVNSASFCITDWNWIYFHYNFTRTK